MSGERARILVIDDEKVIRDSCTRILIPEGNIVKSAENGDTGLNLFKEFHPDLVLVDLKMPGKSGMDVLEEIESIDPNVVKIVITGYATVSSAVDAMKRGAYDFIPKPFTPDEIILIVGRGLEKRRLLLESEALKVEQERVRSNMISLVSHELRAPLAATVQYLEVILGGMAGEVSSEAKEMINRCDIRLREMLELLRKWLNLATFDPDKMAEQFQDVSLCDIARESIEVLKPLAEENKISLILDKPDDLPPIKGSKVSLGEVFNNLISNAIRYNKPGGRVKVKLYGRDEEVWVEISDNGFGINQEHLSRIFDEFYRVDGRRNAPIKGSGLGLSIVKRLVEAHGGMIDVESRFGEGTTFKIGFPKFFQPREGG
jgi:two-component system sensor histidine kinase/response regulator